jgi:hypothetical protein
MILKITDDGVKLASENNDFDLEQSLSHRPKHDRVELLGLECIFFWPW